MEPVILVIHLFLALGIIALVLLQRSEGGGLGMGGGGLGGFSTARGTASALTKATAIFATLFFLTSLTLGVLAGGHSKANKGLLEGLTPETIQTPVAGGGQVGSEYTPPAELNKEVQDAQIDIETVPEESAPAEPPAPDATVPPQEKQKPAAPIAE